MTRHHYVYLLEGPSGVYVGLTNNPSYRERQHRNHARRAGADAQRVNVAMHRDGEASWTFTVVGCSPDRYIGHSFERAVVEQVRREGRNVFNGDVSEAARRGWIRRRVTHPIGCSAPKAPSSPSISTALLAVRATSGAA